MHFLCLAYNEIHLAPPTTTAALLAGVSGVRVLLMILQMRLMTLRCHLPASQSRERGREGGLFGLSKYLLRWQQLNAYEMVITHTPHCAAEGSAATYCRSFILLIAPVGERNWARFIKQLDRKSAQLSSHSQFLWLVSIEDVAVFVISIINFGPLSWVLLRRKKKESQQFDSS